MLTTALRSLNARMSINVDEFQRVAVVLQHILRGNFELHNFLKVIPTLGGRLVDK